MYKQISSTQNSLVKYMLQLQEKSRSRRKEGKFVLEGFRELTLALEGNYTIDTLLFYPEICSYERIKTILENTSNTPECIEISKEVFQKLAYRSSTEGILAIMKTKVHSLDSIAFHNENPLILVAEAPEKPGNIGALLRTADAANVDAVLIANPKTDLYNPNIVRSSVGCVFTTQIATGNTSEIIAFLQNKNIAMYCAALTASEHYHIQDFQKASAIVVGTEATGLSDEWLQNATQNIIIPMQGKIDSMNVSVAAAIILFEAKRQRNFK
ncbi:23S rRNA (uridine(2479)-2'-O)-methyltransferase [Kordia sp. SMS9]|uniref:TrmH family RNA methyltransferase n=1 Tax=Kordia sp. SMS9 TaxID=2282170 RepID=UPI000E0D35D7|nr:RNA methyltransferase [Kordia sp. SMS9]AXG70358.1 23S rRNA (uridine(2479)-2'-O)-methyltransferase [Kordia sp. SMS9]